MSQETHASGALARHLPTFVIILMAIQPLMDILSFWTDRLGMSNTITLLLRFACSDFSPPRARRSTASPSPPVPYCSSGTASPASSSATSASSTT